MIAYDLACANGHVFEGWFGSSADYDAQAARGLVRCPLCDDADIRKAAMAPSLARKGNRGCAGKDPAARGGGGPAEAKAMLRALAEAQSRALTGSDYVGADFADRARAMHDGGEERRPIHGRATVAEAKALVDDGVPVAPLPLPVRAPGEDN